MAEFRRPFRAMPLRPRTANVARFQSRPRRQTRARKWPEISPILVMLPLAVFAAVLLWDGDAGFALPAGAARPGASDGESAQFGRCAGPVRVTCVVDGDTFWYRGEKIRIAGINTPETSSPKCAREAELGEDATRRLTQLLNAGPFTLERDPFGDDRDRYGRALRHVVRGGKSLGATLEAEGLAEHWKGHRGEWC